VTRHYEVVFTRSARRALDTSYPSRSPQPPSSSSSGPLRVDPRRVGKPLREPLAPLYAARRSEYHVLDDFVDTRLVIQVVSIIHRRDAYQR